MIWRSTFIRLTLRRRVRTCHMVRGRGHAIGPDLSDVGSGMTVSEIRESLAQPDARIAPGYHLVTLQLRDGGTLRGFARNRSNFDLQLQDLDGKLHLLHQGDFAGIREEKHSDTRSGVLATAGNVLFHGMASGAFAAMDARDGKPLWHFDTSLKWRASPMTFSLGGRQYVTIASGPTVICSSF